MCCSSFYFCNKTVQEQAKLQTEVTGFGYWKEQLCFIELGSWSWPSNQLHTPCKNSSSSPMQNHAVITTPGINRCLHQWSDVRISWVLCLLMISVSTAADLPKVWFSLAVPFISAHLCYSDGIWRYFLRKLNSVLHKSVLQCIFVNVEETRLCLFEWLWCSKGDYYKPWRFQ